MEHRNGICASCEANFTIPANFEYDQAECSECGGVVDIGPVVNDDSNEPTTDLEEYVPSGRKRSGPSMMEQLRARKAAEAAGAPDDEPADGTPAAAPVARKAAAPKKAPARKAGATKAKAGSSKSGSSTRKSKASGSAAKSSRGGKRASGAKGSGGGRSKKSGSTEKKKGSPGMLIGIAGLVILLGVGGYFFKDDLFGGDAPVDAASTKVAVDTDEATKDSASTDPGADTVIADATSMPDKAAEDTATPAVTPAVEEPKAVPVDPKALKDPATVDLDAITDFGPVDGTTDDFWEELKQRMGRAMNPDIGIGQTKEWKFLEKHPRKAFPVIVNYLKHLDLSTKAGNEKGKWAVRILETNAGGNNFGWKEFEADAEKAGKGYHEWFNKTVVLGWCKAWAKCEMDLNQWKGLAKLSDSDFEKLKKKIGGDAAEPSSLDLLNDDE